MPGSARAMAALTVGGLVLVTAYSVTIGSDGWLWFVWVVLGVATIGAMVARGN
ncbi:hypothetical protein [Streptomyces abikoensis]|uniref:hypothetical protein n=1 Tax=Streptomyces abikoensis TaxID=97398 RepID=UPI00167BA5A4|nr:hypothetical protein [Streptomyces abikoensis]GGP34727.1 hypothetical protein GCM10010214_03970 [Streptomyces abikoensis]